MGQQFKQSMKDLEHVPPKRDRFGIGQCGKNKSIDHWASSFDHPTYSRLRSWRHSRCGNRITHAPSRPTSFSEDGKQRPRRSRYLTTALPGSPGRHGWRHPCCQASSPRHDGHHQSWREAAGRGKRNCLAATGLSQLGFLVASEDPDNPTTDPLSMICTTPRRHCRCDTHASNAPRTPSAKIWRRISTQEVAAATSACGRDATTDARVSANADGSSATCTYAGR